MKLPFTRKTLVGWAGEETVRQAERLVKDGVVLKAEMQGKGIQGAVVVNGREMQTGLRMISPTLVESLCPCYTSRERGMICAHGIALAILLIRRATDPLREAKYRAEQRRAKRLASTDASAFIQRAGPDTPGAVHADVHVCLLADWRETLPHGFVTVTCSLAARGQVVPVDLVPRNTPFALSRQDDNVLFVLEDIAEGPLPRAMRLTTADFVNLLRLYRGRSLADEAGESLHVGDTPLASLLHLDLDRETGDLLLFLHTEMPLMAPGRQPLYALAGRQGWAIGDTHAWPLEATLPLPYQHVYKDTVAIARTDVLRFMRHELPNLEKQMRVQSDLSLDLFTIEPARPRFRLLVRGSPASLSAELHAVYDSIDLLAAKADARAGFALPDPDDLMTYRTRNETAERDALVRLGRTGLTGEVGDALRPVMEKRNVMNFIGSGLPAIRRWGWQIDVEGSVTTLMDQLDFVTPVVHIDSGDGEHWFDVSFTYEDPSGSNLSAADIQTALRRGESYLTLGGRTLLIDAQAVESVGSVFDDCHASGGNQPGHFRVDNVYAAYVKASLDAVDGVDVEDPPAWRKGAETANRSLRMEPVALPPTLDAILRPYQKDGVRWIRFLERNGFCGMLADEMGLGKTVQALAWMQLPRCDEKARDNPILVVCPTSLVENWLDEARRFTPDLTVIIMSGSDRHEQWDALPTAHLVITSYACLRRDVDRYAHVAFSALVLDEAQHIKNRSTQNALAAKALRASHRLVLTGTPMENSVTDLWSIMDFLMPGYLGKLDGFRAGYEQPIARGGSEGAEAQLKLKRKLQPFLLRRLKRDVARELPPKIERILHCRLSPDQAAVYNELLMSARRKIGDMVAKQGFNRSRMAILTLLMRLRQVCCHLDLLKLPNLQPDYPSAKMEQCFELLDEAIDGGHRVLIFSQFVSMLHILRSELEARGLTYCYLDGSTLDRMAEVRRFNTDHSVPVFLISLKAGGTGLNLTGADMVVHFDPWWNPAVENQATDRAYRIGQRRTVYSVKLITADTVEEKVLALQRKKKAVIDATIETDETAPLHGMSWEDVQGILDL